MERLTEDGYGEKLTNEVRPYLETRRRNGYFTASGNAPCFYSVFRPEQDAGKKGTVAIVHGFTESIEKYAEVIWYYLQAGYVVCAYEQRGHGRSHHDNGLIHVTDIDTFERYADDLEIFCSTVVSRLPGPYYLHAHSMGGGVSALYLERGGTFFRKAALNSPLIAPYTSFLPTGLCRGLFRFLILIGQGNHRIFYEKTDYPGEEPYEGSCTSSPERYYGYEKMVKRRTAYFQNYCATNHWAWMGLGLKKTLLAKGGPENVRIPVLVTSAGLDRVVAVPPQKKFASRLRQGKYQIVEGVKHEIYLSPDEKMHPYFETLLSFFGEGKD